MDVASGFPRTVGHGAPGFDALRTGLKIHLENDFLTVARHRNLFVETTDLEAGGPNIENLVFDVHQGMGLGALRVWRRRGACRAFPRRARGISAAHATGRAAHC